MNHHDHTLKIFTTISLRFSPRRYKYPLMIDLPSLLSSLSSHHHLPLFFHLHSINLIYIHSNITTNQPLQHYEVLQPHQSLPPGRCRQRRSCPRGRGHRYQRRSHPCQQSRRQTRPLRPGLPQQHGVRW